MAEGAAKRYAESRSTLTSQGSRETAQLKADLERLRSELERTRQELNEARLELAQSAQTHAEGHSFLTNLVNNLPIAFAYLDKDLVYRLNNPIHSQVIGLPAERILNRHVFEVMPGLKEKTGPIYEGLLAQGRPFHLKDFLMQGSQLGKSHETYWDIAYLPAFNDQKDISGILFLAQEVTERVEKERLQDAQIESLRELDRLKGDFISTASHELRTPLTSIIGYSEFLEDDLAGKLNPEQRQFLGQIQGGAARLQRLVDDILDFSRLEAGSFRLLPQEAELGKVIRDVLAAMLPQAMTKGIFLDEDLASAMLSMRFDPHRIEQVLLNLMGNAIKFTKQGGRVKVSSSLEGDAVRVEVSDTGIGIAPEHTSRLFEKFFQANPGLTREHGGAGLGLSISRALVEAHGGQIGCQSEPNAGSTFWFTLPLTAMIES